MKMWAARAGRKQSLMEQVVRREWDVRLQHWSKNETPPFIEKIYDYSHSFEIDHFFTGSRISLLRNEFQTNGIPRDLMRRCLEVAFSAALSANQQRVYEAAIPDWEQGYRLAENARQALDTFLSWMSAPDPIAWRGPNREKTAASLTHHIVHASFPGDVPINDRIGQAPSP